MAGTFDKYRDLVEQFNKDHGVNFSFEKYETATLRMNNLQSFFAVDGKTAPENNAYRGEFLNLYKEAIENQIHKKSDKKVDPEALLKDFDKLIDNYREYCKKNNRQAPAKNGGWKTGAEVAEAMQNKIRDIKPNKADYVVDEYLAGRFPLRNMRADVNKMRNNSNLSAEELSRAIVYLRALDRIVQGRTTWWKITHWFRNRAEKRDLQLVQDFVMSKRACGFYEEAGAMADENVVGEATEKLGALKALQKIASNEAVKKTAKAALGEVAEETVKAEASSPEKEKAEQLAADPDLNAEMKAQIAEWTSKSTMPAIIKNMGCDMICKNAIERALEMWSTLNEKNPGVVEKNMAESALYFCEGIYIHLDTFRLDCKDRLVVAQNITNMMINKFSPAAFNEKYAKFGDSYYVNSVSVDRIQNLTNVKDFYEARNLLLDAKDEVKADKVRLDLSDDFADKSREEKTAPKIEAPEKTNKEKSF